jgi:hypothetical protein
MKQTAVEWYEKEINSLFEWYEAKQISRADFLIMKHNIFYQAKEMEKEQMIEFANSFYDECGMQYGGLEKSAEEYYNETYEK